MDDREIESGVDALEARLRGVLSESGLPPRACLLACALAIHAVLESTPPAERAGDRRMLLEMLKA
jgi:hypothetical protein